MQEPLQDYIRVGLVHFMAFPECMGGVGPILETIEALCRDPFFEVLEITRINDESTRNSVREIAGQAGVDLCFGAQPLLLGNSLDLNHENEEERRKAIDAIGAGLNEAHSLGVPSLAVLSGSVVEDKEAGQARLVDSLKERCDMGRSRDIRIVLETFDQVPFGKNCLIGPTTDAVNVSEAVRAEYPDFGLMLDLSHLPLLGESSFDAIRTAGDHLVHVHIGNCAMDDPSHPAYGDMHPRFGAPGTRNGIPEVAEFLKVLLDTGYLNRDDRKIVSFEVRPMEGEDPWAVIAGSKRVLLEAWRRT